MIADEAGMIGTRDLAALVEATAAAGAKLVLSGDTRQLAPVAAGAPMRLLVRALGAARMDQIQRQRGRTETEGAWMRAASVDFAAGRTASALEAYDRGGAITWGEDREAAVAALVDAYAGSRRDPEGAGRTRAVLTGWNKDVRELNTRIRDRLNRDGLLPDGNDVEIAAIPRGGSRAEPLALTVGDEVIFGESVEVGGRVIRNADLARVEAITGDATDPVLTLRLAKDGGRLSARASALVGFRERGEPRVPRLQHSYAMTVHAAQGVTVDEAYVADLRGTGAEAIYVAMTRHRRTARLFVDGGRIRERLEATAAGIRSEERGLPGHGGVAHPEPAPVGHTEIRQAFLADCAGGGGKTNVADFAGPDLLGWCGAPVQPRDIPVRPGGRIGLGREENWREALGGVDALPPDEPSPAAGALRRRMDERLRAPAAYPVPRSEPSDRMVPLRADDRGRRSRIGRLAGILWQGLRRRARTRAVAVQELLPEVLRWLSADILLDPRGRALLARRDPSGRIVGLAPTDERRDGTGTPSPAGPNGLTQLGDRRAPKRIYVARTERAALGLYRQDGQPDHSLICALADGPETDTAFAEVVGRHPGAVVQVALGTDEDERTAEAFEVRVVAALGVVRAPRAQVTVRRTVPLDPAAMEQPAISADAISAELGRTRHRAEQVGRDRGRERIVPARPISRSRGR